MIDDELDFEFIVGRLAKPGSWAHTYWNGEFWETDEEWMTDTWIMKIIDPLTADPLRTGTIKLTDIWCD